MGLTSSRASGTEQGSTMETNTRTFESSPVEVADALNLLADQLINGEASMASLVETEVDSDHYQVNISFRIKRNDPDDEYPQVQIMYPV